MRIDGLNRPKFEYDVENEPVKGSFNAASLADIVSVGSVTDFFGDEPQKNALLAAGDGSIESVKEQALVIRDNLTAAYTKMDTGSVVEMNEEGIDLYDEKDDEIVTVVEQIQIKLATYCDDFVPTVDISNDAVKKTLGAGASAIAQKITEAFHKNGIEPSDAIVKEVEAAVSMLDGIEKISDSAKAYMTQNRLDPTISNIYISEHAGYVCQVGKISEDAWHEIEGQAGKWLERYGYDNNEQNLAQCHWMIDNNLDLSTENFDKLNSISEISDNLTIDRIIDRTVATIIEGRSAKEALLNNENCPWEEAKIAIQTVEKATSAHIMAWATRDNEQLTLDDLNKIETEEIETAPDERDIRFITANRSLQELRLMMTLDVAHKMERLGIRTNFTEISNLVEQMKNLESQLIHGTKEETSLIEIEQVRMSMVSIDNLRTAPSAVIGSVVEAGEIPTINAMQYHVAGVSAKLKDANEAYEALSTEIRSDLGDSVSKAITASTDDILGGMGYENSEENKRAVRILAYNSMEFTEANIDKVKNIDFCTNQLFKNMTPKSILAMIQDGINPLETSVEDLNDYLENYNQTYGREIEKYSEFIYRMDKKGNLSADEREKMIGLYGLVNKFSQDGMKAAGALINQGLDLTMGNLLTAYMTRKDANINLKADDETGLGEVKDKISYYKNLFGSARKHLTPEAISKISDNLEETSPEEFAKKLIDDESYRDKISTEKQLNDMRELSRISDDVYRFIRHNEIVPTINNVFATRNLLKNPGAIFSDDALEDEIWSAFEDKETMTEEYDSLARRAKEAIDSSMEESVSHVDFEALRMVGAGMNLLGAMARKNNFCIPFDNDGEKGIINLKILENGDNFGSFQIKFRSDELSNVTILGSIRENSVSASLMSSDSESIKILEAKSRVISETLSEAGYSISQLNINRTSSQPDMRSSDGEIVSAKETFKVAKIFVKELANL